MNSRKIDYKFILDNNTEIDLCLKFDNSTDFLCVEENVDSSPDWVALSFNQCPNCTLDLEKNPVCPIARNLIPVIDVCKNLTSHDQLEMKVKTDERCITGKTTVQRGFSSLVGLIIATSPCPHTLFLKPMARFHLPLANHLETVYRSVSMYLLSEYFHGNKRVSFDASMEKLSQIYLQLQVVNRSLAQRVRSATEQDAAVNAIVELDLFAKDIPFSIEDALEELGSLF